MFRKFTNITRNGMSPQKLAGGSGVRRAAALDDQNVVGGGWSEIGQKVVTSCLDGHVQTLEVCVCFCIFLTMAWMCCVQFFHSSHVFHGWNHTSSNSKFALWLVFWYSNFDGTNLCFQNKQYSRMNYFKYWNVSQFQNFH